MSLSHRQEVLDAHMNHSNWKKLAQIGLSILITAAHESDISVIVPALLQRWRQVDSGLDASSKAYNLSELLKDTTMQWLRDDQLAQETRQKNPSVIDIYNTVKQKGIYNSPQ